MKRINKSLSVKFSLPKIYLDDLEELERIIKSISPKEYVVETDEYQFDSLKELLSSVKSPEGVILKTARPYLNLEFGKNKARLYIYDDSAISAGTINRIKEVIKKKERVLLDFLTNNPLVYLVFALLSFANWIPIGIGKPVPLWLTTSNFIVIIVLFLFLAGSFRGYRTVIFLYRKDDKSFWGRNKDQILIELIKWALPIVLVSVLSYVLGKFNFLHL